MPPSELVMIEKSAVREVTPATKSAPTSFHDMLVDLVGKVVTVVNPESYEDTAMGHTLTTAFGRGKVLNVGEDYLTIVTEFTHKRGGAKGKEPVKQYIPFSRIKRVSLMKGERLLHI